jgi:hypothetical protein
MDLTRVVPSINGRIISLAAHRGVTMSYSSIDGVPKPRRDVNWTLRASSRSRLAARMFAVDLSGGFAVQALSLVEGDIITLDCTLPLVEAGFVAATNLRRTPVPGSVVYLDANGRVIPLATDWPGAYETRWCPRLTMMVLEFTYSGNPLAAESTWSYSLEEVEAEATP